LGGPPVPIAQESAGHAEFPVDMSDTTSQQLVVFSLGSEEYALPIGSVHEIIRFTEPRTVASEAAWIRGVIGLRGKIIPIFDLASRMELDTVDSQPGKIVIVESGTGQVGIMVDEVEEVLTVSSEQLEDVPSANSDSIEAIAKIEDRLVILLNPEGLFARSGAEEIAAA
jgi:purine-binding chemotaxis protein CheW